MAPHRGESPRANGREDRAAWFAELADHARRFDLAPTAEHIVRLLSELDLEALAPVEHEA